MAMKSEHPIRLAFIGTGGWAQRYHLPSLDYIRHQKATGRELQLRGIYGLDHDEALTLGQKYGFDRVYASLDELIRDKDVDVVAMAITPSAVHDVLIQVLGKNVPIFTEKPPGADFHQAQELAQLVRVINVVGFNRRYNSLNNAFKEHLSKLSGITSVRGAMYRINRTEDHFILHTGIHLVNLMEYLFGPIRTVRNEKTVDAATGGTNYLAHLAFESGQAAQLLFAPCSEKHWEGIEVVAEGQTVTLHSPHNDAPGEIVVHRHGSADGEVVDRSGQEIPILEEGYAREYLDLFGAMADGHPTRSNFQNAVNTMRVAEAIELGKDLH